MTLVEGLLLFLVGCGFGAIFGVWGLLPALLFGFFWESIKRRIVQ